MTEYSNEVIIVDSLNNKVISRYNTLTTKDVISYGATLFTDDNSLYASNRGEETIAKFIINKENNLIYDKSFPVYGKHSRHMILSLDKKYIISCNKNTNNICFINKETYKKEYEINFDNPSCIAQII